MEDSSNALISRKPELALPAGSFQCALYAFKGGADAVYLGLRDFSARKGAVNFSFEDVRKLKEICRTQNKKYYVTLNTLVTDDEMPRVERFLKQLDYLKPNGVIVQDLGIARLIREKHPSLQLHGSTQLAVHTVQGVKKLQEMGFTRVVLSRELSFEEVSNIRNECPNIELKVFIHGALCYGFSGLCMASELITGRSANRGECAQICRTWFTTEGCNNRENNTNSFGSNGCVDSSSWLFSMKDFCLGELVKKYAQIGIDSLKVEGRMKSPEYVYWCARYYSLLLNGEDENNKDVQWAKECMQTSFSRKTTTGFFNTTFKESLTCTNYPSHIGVQVGTVEKVLKDRAIIRFTKPVALRDGLLVVSSCGKINESAGFGLSFIEGGRSFINAGETGLINFPTNKFSKKPSFGTPVWCTSRHNQNLPLLNENLPLYKSPMDIGINICEGTIEVACKGFDNIGFERMSFDVEMQPAKNPLDLRVLFQDIFQASGESYFTLGSLEVENHSTIVSPFIPLSVLKRIRRSFYESIDKEFESYLDEPADFPKFKHEVKPKDSLPQRSLLGLWDEISFVLGVSYLPLSPIMFDEKAYLARLDEIVEGNPNLVVGLNNIGQVRWAQKHENIKVYADFFLYTSNSWAYEELASMLPNLIGSYETKEDTSFSYVGEDFNIPLFVSRVCIRHNSLNLSCKGCSKDNFYTISQNGKKYKVICKDCITIVEGEK